jgi:hypothetical protein
MVRISKALQTYQSLLHAELSTSLVSVAVGQTLPLQFRLSNIGHIPVDACIGEARRYSVASDSRTVGTGRPWTNGLVKLIDHPMCSRRFRLQPGEQITWDEQFEIPDLVAGQAKITTTIQIVHPRDCDKYGCYDTMLELSPISVEVR